MNQLGGTDKGGDERNLFQPGDIITMDRRPSEQPAPMPEASRPGERVQNTVGQSDNHDAAALVAQQQPLSAVVASESQSNTYSQAAEPEQLAQPDGVTWTASEFIAHHKSASWYAGLGVAALIIVALIWFLTRDVITAAIIAVGIALLGVYASRKPQQESYSLDEQGLSIGNRHYAYNEFRSFSLVPDGAFAGIEFAPLKRFATYTTVYYDPADEDKILGILSMHLPMEPPRADLTDQLMRRIHF